MAKKTSVETVNDLSGNWTVRSAVLLVRKNGKYIQIRVMNDDAVLDANMTAEALEAATKSRLIAQAVSELRAVRQRGTELF